AAMPSFSRRKSIRRYRRLCPPPCQRLVMWPLLLRPPVRCNGSSSDFSGSVFVTSAKSETERNRVPGVIGRNCRMPISALEHGDRVAFFERDDRLFPGRAPARTAGETARAAPGAHPQDLVRPRIREPHHVHIGDVPPREVDVVRARRAGRENQDLLFRDPELAEQLGQGLGLRLLVLERVYHEKGLLARPRVERRL